MCKKRGDVPYRAATLEDGGESLSNTYEFKRRVSGELQGQEAVTGAGDRCFSGSQARSRRPDPGDLRHLENSLFRCGPVLSRETRL